MTKAHFGCEDCGMQLTSQSKAMSHLHKRAVDPQECRPAPNQKTYKIGIGLWLSLHEIYKKKGLDPKTKWIEWWKLLCPEKPEPDPLHHETICLSTADIPKIQEMFGMLWDKTSLLPVLSPEQKELQAGLVDKLFQLIPRVSKPRRQRIQGQRQQQRQQEAQQGTQQQHPQHPQQLQQGAEDIDANMGGYDFLDMSGYCFIQPPWDPT